MKSSILAPRSRPPLAAIRLGRAARSDAELRFGVWLIVYMRALALGWLAQGLFNWAMVMLSDDKGQGAFDAMPALGAAAIVVFAVLDLIAAVGLWLASAWGGVVWLVAVAGQWLVLLVLPGFFPLDIPLGLLDVLLVAGYFVLTYRAARELDQ